MKEFLLEVIEGNLNKNARFKLVKLKIYQKKTAQTDYEKQERVSNKRMSR